MRPTFTGLNVSGSSRRSLAPTVTVAVVNSSLSWPTSRADTSTGRSVGFSSVTVSVFEDSASMRPKSSLRGDTRAQASTPAPRRGIRRIGSRLASERMTSMAGRLPGFSGAKRTFIPHSLPGWRLCGPSWVKLARYCALRPLHPDVAHLDARAAHIAQRDSRLTAVEDGHTLEIDAPRRGRQPAIRHRGTLPVRAPGEQTHHESPQAPPPTHGPYPHPCT